MDLGCLGVADRWADLAVATWSTTWNYGTGWERGLLYAYWDAQKRRRCGQAQLPKVSCTQLESLSLLAWRLVDLGGVPGVRQHLAELVLSEQLVRFEVLKCARASDRDTQRRGADRVRYIDDEEHQSESGPAHP